MGRHIRFRPGHYLDLPGGMLAGKGGDALLECAAHRGVRGVTARFTWRRLEPKRDQYDFSGIDALFARAAKLGKPAMVFIGDKSFSKDGVDVPDYVVTELDGLVLIDPNGNAKQLKRGGGGSMPRRWDPRVNERYLRLLGELGRRYDTHEGFESLLFQETHSGGFLVGPTYKTEDHLAAIRARLQAARAAMPHTQVCQYTNANFDDRLKEPAVPIGEYLREIRGMLGAPDILPFQPTQAKGLHPHYTRLNGVIPLSAAMQNDSYRHKQPHLAEDGRVVPMDEMLDFALDKMHLNHVVWNYVVLGSGGYTSDFQGDALKSIAGRAGAFDREWKFSW